MKAVIQQVEQLITRFSTRCPFELAAYLQITILLTDLPDRINGFFLNVLDQPFIYLNDQLPEQQKRIILAHELGHAVLHPLQNSLYMRNSTYLVLSRYELQADMFAAHFLLEDALFDDMINGFDTLEKISCVTEVPLAYVQLKWDYLSSQRSLL